jgi:simple sugar transport system ATP-binding protein
MVYQHFTLVPSMTVAENLILARPDLPRIVDWHREIEHMEGFISRVPFKIDLKAAASELAAGEKQKVEIVKQLYLGSRIVILDEPTSVLTPDEADEILGLLRAEADAGRLSILLITHKLREVMAFAREVSVLRHGKLVDHAPVGHVTRQTLGALMVGRSDIAGLATRSGAPPGRERLRVEGLHAENDKGQEAVKDLSFSVRSGEIVGIAGVSGNGQREIVEAISGQRTPTGGRILVHGRSYAARRGEMRREKVCCLPEEPIRNACVGRMTLAENLAFRDFDRMPFAVWGFLRPAAFREAAREKISRFGIRPPRPEASVETLSGGNVQRLVLARELSGDVEVLVVANPCFGLDIAAIGEIRRKIVETRNRGAAVLLVSEDLDEIFELADRILVMFEGRIAHETLAATADRHEVGRYMAGH